MSELVITREYYQGDGIIRLVNWVIGLIEFSLVIRLVLGLFGADTSSPFVAWVYNITSLFMAPFANAFPALALGSGYVLEVSLLLALVGYVIIGYLCTQLLLLLFSSLSRI